MYTFRLLAVLMLLGLLATACGNGQPTATVKTTDPFAPANPDFNEFLTLINQFRAQPQTCKNGEADENMPAVPPLKPNENLSTSARLHSEDMATNNFFSHTSPDGRTIFQRNVAAGYTGNSRSENIARVSPTIQDTLDLWRTSTTGHCQTLMDPNATEVGIGYGFNAQQPFGHFWTLVTGKEK